MRVGNQPSSPEDACRGRLRKPEASAISRDGTRLLRGKGGIVHFAAMRDKGIYMNFYNSCVEQCPVHVIVTCRGP